MKPHKLTRYSNPNLVALRRYCFRQLAKAKLLNQTSAGDFERRLKEIDTELANRNITIQDPELE